MEKFVSVPRFMGGAQFLTGGNVPPSPLVAASDPKELSLVEFGFCRRSIKI